MSSEICATDTPTSAGAMRLSTRFTPGWRQASRSPAKPRAKRGMQPMARSAGIWIAACSKPPNMTPAASASTGFSPHPWNSGAPHQAAAMTARFSSTGVTAGTAKRFQVLRMPADSATSDMKAM